MRFQSAGIGRLCSWDRSSAGGLVVLFAGVGFFCGTVGAMANEIGIPFAGVQVLCGGASGVSSEVWVQSAGVGPTFCVTGCTAICLVYSSYMSRCHAHPLSIHIPSVIIPCFSTEMLFLCIRHQKGRG